MLQTGKWGEDEAEKFLKNKGYRIVARNYRFKKTEIDIIVVKDNVVVAVEVKTRTGVKVESPFFAISRQKQRNLILGINAYVQNFKQEVETRMDAISIVKWDNTFNITHIEDAFPPF